VLVWVYEAEMLACLLQEWRLVDSRPFFDQVPIVLWALAHLEVPESKFVLISMTPYEDTRVERTGLDPTPGALARGVFLRDA
jgi:hypothetical protein